LTIQELWLMMLPLRESLAHMGENMGIVEGLGVWFMMSLVFVSCLGKVCEAADRRARNR
jgi:hypothetical protein